ncbi:5-formyltetrahydrofolate cyclo-ligase [Hoylesella shahii]|jgi:5-formyltetrahydrofolate cyclo-ligase
MKETDNEEMQNITLYIKALMYSFTPAETPEEATHYFSTLDVIEGIKKINPGLALSAEKVSNALLEAGFRICNRPSAQGISFRWMFREKTSFDNNRT